MLDKLLKKTGLRFEDLDTPGHSGEKDYLLKMQADLQKNKVNIQSTREYLASMRESVERELVDEPEFNYIFIFKVPNRKQIYLKARLKNYMLLELYLSTPERLKKQMEDAVSGMIKST